MGVEAAIAWTVATIGVSTATATLIVSFVISTVLSTAAALITKKSLPGSPDLSAKTITSRGTVDPQKIIYGESLVAGTLAYRNALGTKNREMWGVHLLAGHECEAISDCWLDDRVITEAQINSGATAGGAVTSGDYGPVRSQTVCAVYKHFGTSTQTANSALVSKAAQWTTSHRLRGIAYAVTQFVLWDKTQTLWEAGDPRNVKFLVKGKKVYDPRLDTSPGANPDNASYIAWSDNPALCTADFLRDSKFSPLANGIAASRIDWDAVAAAADDCDVLVPIPPVTSPITTEKKFTCNGVLYGTDSPEENISRLLSSFNGSLGFTGGKYVISAGVYEAPVDSLSEDDVIGAITVNSSLDSDKRINTLKAIYTDPDKQYEVTETVGSELYKDERDKGEELVNTVELPLTSSWYMAQRICLLQLQEANQELTITVPCNLKAARLVPGERVNFTLTERGWTPKIFKVMSWSFFDQGGDKLGVNVRLKEDASIAYTAPDVSDYNTANFFGELTIADPTPYPDVNDPRSIQAGEGSWNFTLVNNSDDGTVDSNDGEVWLGSGVFAPPSGAVRTLTSGYVFTPYDIVTAPPDQVAYIVWGTTAPDTRFGADAYGNGAAEAAGLFCAVYDRFADQWYAVANTNTETAFTPASDDYVVARIMKTTTTGGIDTLTSLVAYVEDPQATNNTGALADLDTITNAQNETIRVVLNSGLPLFNRETATTAEAGPSGSTAEWYYKYSSFAGTYFQGGSTGDFGVAYPYIITSVGIFEGDDAIGEVELYTAVEYGLATASPSRSGTTQAMRTFYRSFTELNSSGLAASDLTVLVDGATTNEWDGTTGAGGVEEYDTDNYDGDKAVYPIKVTHTASGAEVEFSALLAGIGPFTVTGTGTKG